MSARRHDLVPKNAGIDKVLVHLAGQGRGSDAKQLAKYGVIILNDVTLLVHELDAGPDVTTAVREPGQMVVYLVKEGGYTSPTSRCLEKPVE